MPINVASQGRSRRVSTSGILRFCTLLLLLSVVSGCARYGEDAGTLVLDSAVAVETTAKTATGSANDAQLAKLESPIPLPDGVEVGHLPPHWYGTTWDRDRAAWIKAVLWVLYSIVALICVYGVRHYTFTYNRLYGRQRHTYLPIDVANWPSLTVLIPCHNEERVVASILEALLAADYPADRMRIVPVNDRSTDGTRDIIDRYAANHATRIFPLHREGGTPGKAAALQDAIADVTDDVILVFDADYLPGRDLIKRLAAPFLDPQVGAVMGRVVPVNTPRNLLTRLLDLERCGGYQVDQQARMNLKVIAQYGGTVGGVRVSALKAVGGWREDSLAEDTDITFRLVLGGWKIAYSNRYECYEEVPETWPVRIRQIMRWARGHTDAAVRYMPGLWSRPRLTFRERLDGALLLGTYLMSPILLIGWFLAILAFYLGANPFLGAVAIFSVAAYNTIGNFAAFFEIGAAAHLDGTERRIRILPLVLGGFLVSLVSTSRAVMTQLWPRRRKEVVWDKTERYRTPASAEETIRSADAIPAVPQPVPAPAPMAPAPMAPPAQRPMRPAAVAPAPAPDRAANREAAPRPPAWAPIQRSTPAPQQAAPAPPQAAPAPQQQAAPAPQQAAPAPQQPSPKPPQSGPRPADELRKRDRRPPSAPDRVASRAPTVGHRIPSSPKKQS
ncbi:MAG: glycosyltransferase family 2 protein [Rhodothermales bacterium]|nr:glycosyltransferase family 2 protein [Rhodothermales bacterium]